ncbi:hypothetical protein [Agromyces sp. NPDC058126]|uniref:hypothetical protein n=1 Tax=Agromyces sp. NPDC058126 TaxID=3346350 RepID=UPI0036DE71BF
MSDADGTWVTVVPKDETAKRELLGLRPPAWEYLLFGAELLRRLGEIEPKWRDYSLGYSMTVGPRIAQENLSPEFSERLSRLTFIASNIERVISLQAQSAAFGEPGASGDAALIEHMAGRLVQLYEQLIDWATEIRSLRLPSKASGLAELAVAMTAQPIQAVRDFVHRFVEDLERGLHQLASGESTSLTIEMRLTLEVDDDITDRWTRELKSAVR